MLHSASWKSITGDLFYKSSDNEIVRQFRLGFLFSTFPLANSRFSVWCPCWWNCKLTEVARTEWDKTFHRVVIIIVIVVVTVLFVLRFHFQCHVFATYLLQLRKPYPNKRKRLKCITVPEKELDMFLYKETRQVTNYLKSSNTRSLFIVWE